jgi:5-methylcytosine-specific restriction endonuclease McrA
MQAELPKKPRRSLPNGEVWNQASWKAARKRAIASKEPICASCHNFIDVTLPMKLPDGSRDPMSVEVDHKEPTSRGGSLYDQENLQLMHMRCNRKKGAKMESDYDGLNAFENPVPLSNRW